MSKVNTIVLAVVLFYFNLLLAQNQNNQWRFGNGLGVNFNTTPPTAVNGIPINTNEGSASIADKTTGDLLFYTDGVKVWNANNVVMPNGSGLFGGTGDPNLSSTSAAVIVPKPFSDNLYYIITVDDQAGNEGMCYSLVDMSLNGGLGDVVLGQKNIFLYNTKCEKLSVVPNATNCGYWLVAHAGVGTTHYVAFQITANGITLSPVISNIGQTPTNNVGHFKINRQLNKLAVGDKDTRKIELFDFNNATGVISNVIDWIYPSTLTDSFYGVEFSPDGSKLYMTNAYALFQYDLSVLNDTAIANSFYDFTPFFSYPPNFDTPAALQLAPDNKIYIASGNLFTINFPNLSGANAVLQESDIAGLQGEVKLGLPQWVYSIDNPPNTIIQTANCILDAIPFSLQNTTGIVNVNWDFGDPTSGINNTATGLNPSHNFSNSGDFTVTATIDYNCRSEVVTKIVTIIGAQTVAVTPINLCQNATAPALPLTIPNTTITGTWLPTTINTANLGTTSYTFTADGGQCVSPQTTTLEVTVLPNASPLFSLPTTLCSGTLAPILPQQSDNGITGTWTPSIVNNIESGTYSFIPNPEQCAATIAINIDVSALPLPSITQGCEENKYMATIANNNSGDSFSWRDASNNVIGNTIQQQITISGDYSVIVTNDGCSATLPFTVDSVNCIVKIPKGISPNNDGENDSFDLTPFNVARLEIFNRYGTEVFAGNNYKKEWDGKSKNGKDLPSATYFYLIQFDNGTTETGWVYLIR